MPIPCRGTVHRTKGGNHDCIDDAAPTSKLPDARPRDQGATCIHSLVLTIISAEGLLLPLLQSTAGKVIHPGHRLSKGCSPDLSPGSPAPEASSPNL